MQAVSIQAENRSGIGERSGRARRRLGGLSRGALLLGTSLLAWSLTPGSAYAANECGAPPPGGGTVTCTPGGNPYPGGVDYDPVVEDLTVVLEPGVVVGNAGNVVNPNGVAIGSSVAGVDLLLQAGTDTTIFTNADGHDGADVVSSNGTATVIVDSVETSGANSRGVVADADGDVAVTSDSVTTLGEFSAGIFAESESGSVTVDSRSVLTARDGSTGISATTGAGNKYSGGTVQVTSDTLTTEGDDSTGIFAASLGDVTIDSGFILTRGDGSDGIAAVSILGDLDIVSDGIFLQGDQSSGILGISFFGDVTIENSNFISANGEGSEGINAESKYGDVTIDSLAVNSGAAGITGQSKYGDVTIDSVAVLTTGDNAPGILAIADSFSPDPVQDLDGVVIVRSELVQTQGDSSIGISATGATVTVVSETVSTLGDDSPGIHAVSLGIRPGEPKYGGSEAILPLAVGPGGTSVTSGSVTTAGDYSIGIEAISYTGDVEVISTGMVTTTGDNSGGIEARAYEGSVAVTSGSVGTGGFSSRGIFVSAATGATVDSSAVATTGNSSGGLAIFSSAGVTDVTSITVTTTGSGSTGINAQGPTVIVRSTSVTTEGIVSDGISARSSGPGGTSVTSGSVTTSGGTSKGIVAVADTGDTDVTSTGTVRTGGDRSTGIDGTAAGTLTIDSNVVVTTGDYATGIVAHQLGAPDEETSSTTSEGGIGAEALGPSGGISIRSGSITTSGYYSRGVYALALEGEVEIYSEGQIGTTGDESDGILAVSRTGAVRVDSEGISVSGEGSDGIVAIAATDLGITIRGLVQSTQGFAVATFGQTETIHIVAGGTVRGRVALGSFSSRLDNDGLFDAIGTSLFEESDNLFNNNAGGVVSSFNGAAVFDGLETFNNRGRIDMRDGARGDTLNIPGTYNGLAGARLGVDVDLTAALADVLILGPATGSTLIDLNLQGNVFAQNSAGILVVDASAGTASTAFALAGGNVTESYIRRQLIFDAPNFNFLLVTGPEQPLFEWAELGEIGTGIWYLGADALTAQLEAWRDGGLSGAGGGSALAQASSSGRGKKGFGFWVEGVLGDAEREGVQTFGNAVFDVSYDQDYLGVQGGLDYMTGNVRFGITFGIGNADSTFLASGNRLDVDDKNVGVYLALDTRGGFFFHGLAKMDWLELDADPGPGLAARFDGRAFGIEANAGFKFALGNLFAEPSVGLSWVNTDFDDIISGPATIVVEDVRSMRARAGLRIGGDFAMGNGTLSPFVGVQGYQELEGDAVTNFTLGQTLTLTDEPAGSRGVLNLGASFQSGGFEAFARGDLNFTGTDGKSIRAGVRLHF